MFLAICSHDSPVACQQLWKNSPFGSVRGEELWPCVLSRSRSSFWFTVVYPQSTWKSPPMQVKTALTLLTQNAVAETKFDFSFNLHLFFSQNSEKIMNND